METNNLKSRTRHVLANGNQNVDYNRTQNCLLTVTNKLHAHIFFYMSDFTSTIYGQSFEKRWRQYWRLCKEAALYLLLVSLFMTTDFVESQSFILSALGGSRHSLFEPIVYHLLVNSVIKLYLATQGHLRQWHKMQLILTTKTQYSQ